MPDTAPLPTVADLTRVVDACSAALDTGRSEDWAVRAGDTEWDVARTVAHLADACLWYTVDLTAGGRELELVDIHTPKDPDPDALIDTVRTTWTIFHTVLEATPPEQRGFHPYGSADRTGFVAMACDEFLVHTGDMAGTLTLPFDPPADVVAATVHRLFPWAHGIDADPWSTLLWCNGRQALPGRPRLARWRWQCAPLEEWDGTDPSTPRL